MGGCEAEEEEVQEVGEEDVGGEVVEEVGGRGGGVAEGAGEEGGGAEAEVESAGSGYDGLGRELDLG